MNRRRRLRTAALLLLFSALGGCSTGGSSGPAPRPATPPTFVLAWVAPGGRVRTVESIDGSGWFRSGVDPHATTLTDTMGPAIAHDRAFTWMLMWVNGLELQYKIGFGGRTPTAGINWEQSPTVNRLLANTNASPALAFGNGRWVVVFRRPGGQLHVTRSRAGGVADWETPVDVLHDENPPRPALSTRAPAMVFGRFGGREMFLLVYVHQSLGAVAATSPDGLTWSPRTAIGPAEKDPALLVDSARVYALLSRQVGTTATSFHGYVYKSTDGTSWSEIASYPGAANNSTGAGMAYGACQLVITEQIGGALGGSFVGISRRGGAPSGRCDDPRAFTIGGDRSISLDLVTNETVGNSGARTAVSFGAGASVVQRRLLITEWFPEVIELHLDEPTGTVLDLSGFSLEVRAKPNHQARVDLLGTMSGGDFRIVFEEFGYTGPPVSATFTDQVRGSIPGIKVKQDFFGWDLGGTSSSFRVSGASANGKVDDVVLIGNRPRPTIGGTFVEDTAVPLPAGATLGTISRKFGPDGPIDTDKESDWATGPRSFGGPTP